MTAVAAVAAALAVLDVVGSTRPATATAHPGRAAPSVPGAVVPRPAPASPTPTTDIAAVRPTGRLTPGSTFAGITAARVCTPGYAANARNVTSATRTGVFRSYGVPTRSRRNYQLDHLVPLELGGDNTARNLWPEPETGVGSSSVKDHLENHLHALVCSGQVPLAEAQRAIAGDWFAAAARYDPITVGR